MICVSLPEANSLLLLLGDFLWFSFLRLVRQNISIKHLYHFMLSVVDINNNYNNNVRMIY